QLAELGFGNLTALDYSPAMLKTAAEKRHKGSPVYRELIEADLNQPLEISDNSYDAIICTGTFTHAHVGANCLDELFRIMKPGGLFACTVHKDIWDKSGFSEKTFGMETRSILVTKSCELDIYFETDEEPQGWYLIWEKVS
ncbi:MAG: class I SAM-dependent methyltransferase, partial [Pseudomonadota bacterium]